MHRILGAFSYLHAAGMVYCDMKPDNFMLEGTPPDVKLIDMGGVRRLDDPGGELYGTRGYSAPKRARAHRGLRPVHDRPHAGRIADGIPLPERYEFDLPPPEEQEVLAGTSRCIVLLKATQRDPNLRFQSADEMADQLAGVLREVVAAPVRPSPPTARTFRAMPWRCTRNSTPQSQTASRLESAARRSGRRLSALDLHREQTFAGGRDVREGSRNCSIPGNWNSAWRGPDRAGIVFRGRGVARPVRQGGPFDWRLAWIAGYSLLAQGRAAAAYTAFDQVYNELPGEPAVSWRWPWRPRPPATTPLPSRLYDLVSTTDPSYVTASFGLARCLARGASGPERSPPMNACRPVPACTRGRKSGWPAC